MTKPAWWDMDARGRELNKIIRHCRTKYWKAENNNQHDLAETYFRRISICEKLLQPYVQEVTGIRKILAQNDRRKDIPQLTE